MSQSHVHSPRGRPEGLEVTYLRSPELLGVLSSEPESGGISHAFPLPSRCSSVTLFELDGGDKGFEHGFELVGEFGRVGGVDHQVDPVDVDGPEHDVFGGVTI